MQSGIYQIINLRSGKYYVGSAINIDKRWREHRHHLNRGTHHSAKLQNSWNKHGHEQFTFVIVEVISDLDKLISAEQFWMDKLKAFGEKGYNISPKAGSSLGVTHTRETRRKVGDASRGRTHSLETRAAISLSNRTRIVSEQTREKISAAGRLRVVTEETKKKMSESAMGRQFSAETRAKISAARQKQVTR